MTSADLELTLGGRRLRFPAVWLRDNCPCTECQDPGSGQKLKDITQIPNDLGVAASENAGESVLVTFAPDGHRSTFSRSWLATCALDGYADSDGRTEDDKDLWLAADLAPRNPTTPANLPQASWPRYLDRPDSGTDRIRALEDVLRLGFVLLHDVPAEPGMVLEVAASFGFVRETNYGRLFDVRVEPEPGNLAFTNRAILPHTDNPYRDPAPTVQLLHCLRTAVKGTGSLAEVTLAWWTASRPPQRSGPSTRNRLTRWREHPSRSAISIKRPSYGPACRSSSSARAAGSGGCGSTTGQRARCGCPTRRSPRSTTPTAGGLSCWRGPNGS